MRRVRVRTVVAIVLLAVSKPILNAAQQQGAPPGGVVGGVVGGLPAAPPPPPPPPGAPLRIGGTIKQPTKTKNVPPVYPAIAQSARVQGVVIMEAVIGTDGRVANTRVLRSIPLLDQAAVDAVKQWEFTPTLVNGVAVPVIMTVTVQFTLDTNLPPLQRMTPETRPQVLAELDKRRALWATARPAAYSLRLTTAGAPPASAEVSVVRDGKAVSGSATVESVFARLTQEVQTADMVAIAFSATQGFPTEFQIVTAATPAPGVRIRVELTPVAP